MTVKESKDFFKKCCENLGLVCDEVVKLGAGNPKKATSFIYQSAPKTRKISQLFAVKYFEGENVYIAWNLREPHATAKTTFHLSKSRITGLKPGQILVAKKGVEYPGWDAENVFAFHPDAAMRFLKEYVASRK